MPRPTTKSDLYIAANTQFEKMRISIDTVSHGDEPLFTKGHYPWTGGTTLGSYAVSVAPGA